MMDKIEYEKLRDRVKVTCTKERHLTEFSELIDRSDLECTRQQKAGLTRIIRARNEEADDYDMYMSQF
jgi:hypothetical protein